MDKIIALIKTNFSLVTTILLSIIALLLKPSFQTNDDEFFIYAFSGTSFFDGVSFSNCIHLTKLLGCLMMWLYANLGAWGVEYYTLFLYLVLLLSSTTINSIICDKILNGHKKQNLYIYLAIQVSFTLPFFILLQFTMVTVLATIASYVVIRQKNNKLLGIILILLATLLRYQIVVPLLLMFAIFEATLTLTNIKYFKQQFFSKAQKISKHSLILIAVSLTINMLNSLTYTEMENEFKEYAKIMSSIADNGEDPNSYINEKTGEKPFINWKREGHSLVMVFFFSDTNLYNPEVKYSEIVKTKSKRLSNIPTNVKIYAQNTYKTLKSFTFNRVVAILLIIVIILGPNKSNWVRFVITILAYCTITFTITIILRPPPFHLEFPIFIALCILSLIELDKKDSIVTQRDVNRKTQVFVIYTLPLAILILSFANLYRYYNRQWNYNKQQLVIPKKSNEYFYIFEPWHPSIINPFLKSHESELTNAFTWSIWSNHPSIYEHNKSMNGVTDLTTTIIANPSKFHFVISDEFSPYFINCYKKFIHTHYRKEVCFEKIEDLSNGYSEFRTQIKPLIE